MQIVKVLMITIMLAFFSVNAFAVEQIVIDDTPINIVHDKIINDSIKQNRRIVVNEPDYIITETIVSSDWGWNYFFGNCATVRSKYLLSQLGNNVKLKMENSAITSQSEVPVTLNLVKKEHKPKELKYFYSYLLMDSYNTIRAYKYIFNGAYAYGFDYYMIKDDYVIKKVYYNTPASRAGLREDDIVVEFDNIKLKNLTQYEMCQLIDAKYRHMGVFKVLRGKTKNKPGKIIEIKIIPEYINFNE